MLVHWNLNKTENSSTEKKINVKNKKSGSLERTLFEDGINEALLESSLENSFDPDLIMDGLDLIENKLLNQPNQANYFEYKTYIKMVSDKILKKAYKIKILKDTRKKQFEIVRVIDQNLNELYKMIMSKNANRNKISLLMGTIKGIILDLNV